MKQLPLYMCTSTMRTSLKIHVALSLDNVQVKYNIATIHYATVEGSYTTYTILMAAKCIFGIIYSQRIK